MKITAKASGGFAGRGDCFELDTACRADGAAIEALLEQLDFFGAAPSPAAGADLIRWEITTDDGQRCHTVVLHEDGFDQAGWPVLLAYLRADARGTGS
jgi:hypothetical protein